MEQIRLNNILDRPGSDVSLFTAFGTVSTGRTTYKAPWIEDTELVSDMIPSLDLAYYYRSGEKLTTPFLRSLIDTAPLLHPDKKLLQTDLTILANQCLAIFCDKWTREWSTRLAEYDPLNNYDMTEIMTNDQKITQYGKANTRTDNLSHAKTGTETDATTPNLTTTESKNVYGFNSTDPTPSESNTTGTTGTSTTITTHNTTDMDSGTQTDTLSGSDTETRNYSLSRSGNIGVTTSQQMLESERAVWLWSYFYDVVFPDIDTLTVLRVY